MLTKLFFLSNPCSIGVLQHQKETTPLTLLGFGLPPLLRSLFSFLNALEQCFAVSVFYLAQVHAQPLGQILRMS